MSNQRILRYQVVLMENPGLTISPCEVLNPATLLPTPEGPLPFHSCLETLDHWTKPREGLSEDPLTNPEEIWYTDGSSFVLDGKRRAGYAVVSNFETIEAKPLPPGTSAQLAELIALTRALELGKGKRIAIYTDSKYAFLVLHAHAAVWKERGHLTTRGSPIKYDDQILRLLEAVHLPTEVSVFHCKRHQKGNTEVARGNQAADQAARRAALQNHDLIGIATLVPQTNLPETPSYPEVRFLKLRVRAFKKITWGGSKRRDHYKANGLLFSHLPIKQPPRSSKTPAGPACPTTWALPRRGLADGLHPDASFSRV